MSKSNKVIDYPDLSIGIRPGMREAVELWIKRFKDEHLHIEVQPRIIKETSLAINSTDFIALLGYVDPQDCSEIDIRGFLKSGKKQLEQLLIKSVSLDHRSHYTWCITAMKSLELGRFLDEEDQ